MLALKRTNITATWTNASVKISINLSLVKFLSNSNVSMQVKNSGDIAVSARTIDKLMITSDDPNAAFMRHAFPDSTIQLWNQNVVNGEYIIAYEFNPGLHHKLQTMLPKVCLRVNVIRSVFLAHNQILCDYIRSHVTMP